MRVLDPGHRYALQCFDVDGFQEQELTFMKRQGAMYPGNKNSYPGTNLQETVRAQIDRVKYLDGQVPHRRNRAIINLYREILEHLEERAAERHGRRLHLNPARNIEDEPTCLKCGHIGCTDHRMAA